MSTDTPYTPSDVELLHNYLGKTLQHPDEPRSLDDALAGFEKVLSPVARVCAKMCDRRKALLEKGTG